MNAYNIYLESPDSFQTDLDRYINASGDALRSQAARWLDRRVAVALAVVPQGTSGDPLRDAARLDRQAV